jgi:hypothetical protein
MKFSLINKMTTALAIVVISVAISSCVKDKFDAPPALTNADPSNIQRTMSLHDFKAKYTNRLTVNVYDSIRPTLITDSIILSGIVNGDDKSGAFYKQIVFQDETGGMQIKVDATGLFNDYPVGRRVFIKCKGLYLYYYLGSLELGSYIDTTGSQPSLGGIPAPLIPKFIVKGSSGNVLTPQRYTIAQLNAANQQDQQSTLIRIDSIEFTPPDTALTYADPYNKAYGNINFVDKFRYSSVLRTSGYADFAAIPVPNNSGTLIGVFTIYAKSNGTTVNQINIRDTSDVQFNSPRF